MRRCPRSPCIGENVLKLAVAHLHVSFYSGDEPAVSPLLRYSYNQAHVP